MNHIGASCSRNEYNICCAVEIIREDMGKTFVFVTSHFALDEVGC